MNKIECIVCYKNKYNCCHNVCKTCIIKSGKNSCPICRQLVELTLKEEKKLIDKKNNLEINSFKDANPYLFSLQLKKKDIQQIIKFIKNEF